MKARSLEKSLAYVQNRLWYIITMALLAIISAVMLIYEFYGNVSESTKILLQDLDLAIAYIFLTDFVLAMVLSRRGLKYIKENWMDFLGSIPLSDNLFRAMRILRFTRLVRVMRSINTGLNVRDGINKISKKRKR